VGIVPDKDTVKDLKDRAFRKEREDNKNVRLIYQGKILQDADLLAKYSKKNIYVYYWVYRPVRWGVCSRVYN
jgi:hypothetical protein